VLRALNLVEDRQCRSFDASPPREWASWWLSPFIAIGIFQFFRGAGIGGLWIAFIGMVSAASRARKLRAGRRSPMLFRA